jgi:hypothetical protein
MAVTAERALVLVAEMAAAACNRCKFLVVLLLKRLWTSTPVLRCAHVRVSSYSEVDAVELRFVVNSGTRDAKQERRKTSGSRLVVSNV